MSANTFGQRLRITSFGESHGVALGAIIDGCPAGVPFDYSLLKKELSRRRPGRNSVTSDRQENDFPEVLSGVYEGKTLGTPIAIIIRNHDTRSEDYKKILTEPRPGHADDLWKIKYGHTDHRGGGRSSGRETIARVLGGAIAQMVLKELCPTFKVFSYSSQIGSISLSECEIQKIESQLANQQLEIDSFSTRMPDIKKNRAIEELLLDAKKNGTSYGGTAKILMLNPKSGLGQPVFHKLKSDLASAFMSIGATAGVELGDGQQAIDAEGSHFHRQQNQNHYGGIRGGISSGEPILFRVFFKPTSSVLDTAKKGRHDPCIVIRAIPVLEAMAWMVMADHMLWARQDQIQSPSAGLKV